ncbi:hypothetical protein ABW20_dc0107318 [Dactylellina cionopaga]|nr:hypothetical protein ABW20_dc0107318 [Dactylellina cionopaga]
MSVARQILGPVIGLNLWSLFIEGWMYATRIPAVQRNQAAIKSDMTMEQFNALMPPSTRWKADNYNNLMQQPLQFYAVALTMAVLDEGNKTDVRLAWAYVGVRVLHSLVHCIANPIPVRFYLFVTSSGVLAVMTVRAAMAVFA